MLKVLVVDDEPKVRRGVSRLIEMHPEKYELMGSCAGAADVVELLGQRVPDVIVTDIRMPKQDGLELINHLKHRYHNLDFIILSGYGDFEYAKRALQYQVFDFLLKPLKAEELYGALDGVARKREDDQVMRAESLEDNQFFNLIRAARQEEEEKNLELLGLREKAGGFRVAVFDMGELTEKLLLAPELWRTEIKNLFPAVGEIYLCFGYQMILILREEPEHSRMAEVMRELEKKHSGKIFLGISGRREDYRELKAAYFEALDAVKQYIYGGERSIFWADEAPGEHTAFPREIVDKITNSVKAGSSETVARQLFELFRYYRERRCGVLTLKRHLQLLEREVEALSEELGMDLHCSSAIRDFVKNFEEIRSLAEAEAVLEKNLLEIAREAGLIVQRKMNTFYMGQILDYVQQNFTRDLSMEEVADHVNLSVGYLSNYFKSKMEMNFVDYLTSLRMERAKDLLIHTHEKVYRVAELVGYQNSQYFVTAFKKKTGVTPTEYRKCFTK